MENWDGKPSKQWKARANAHQAAIDSGDPVEYAKVFKELYGLDQDGSLRAGDRTHYKQTEELLVEELAKAMKKTRRQARSLLMKAVKS